MKKTYIFLLLLIVVSCGKQMTEQERIEALLLQKVQEVDELKQIEPLDMVLDSAFAPYDNPKLTKGMCEVLQRAFGNDIDSLQSCMAIVYLASLQLDSIRESRKWNLGDKNENQLFYQKTQPYFEIINKYRSVFVDRIDAEKGATFNQSYGLVPSVDGKVKRREFLGFKVTFRFHREKEGKLITDSAVYLLNDKKNEILDSYDASNPFFPYAVRDIESEKKKRMVIR